MPFRRAERSLLAMMKTTQQRIQAELHDKRNPRYISIAGSVEE